MRLPRRAAHQESAGADYVAGAWRFGASALFVGSRPDGGVVLGGYGVARPARRLAASQPSGASRPSSRTRSIASVEPVRDYRGLGRQALARRALRSAGLVTTRPMRCERRRADRPRRCSPRRRAGSRAPSACSPARPASASRRPEIMWTIRVPRVLAGFGAGAALALAGALMQLLTRNALADPYVLGVAGGAAVGALGAMLVAGATGSAAFRVGRRGGRAPSAPPPRRRCSSACSGAASRAPRCRRGGRAARPRCCSSA